MNTFFLARTKPALLSLIKNADEEILKEILDPCFSEGALSYFNSLKENLQEIQFLTQFPAQATKLPAFCYILGNLQTPLATQSYSYINDELTDAEMAVQQKIVRALGYKGHAVNVNAAIAESQVMIAIYATNKTEVSWLMQLMDFILKMHQAIFATEGVLDTSVSQTDLRLRQELYPLDVPTRILTVSFKMQKIYPVLPEEGYPFNVDLYKEDGSIDRMGAVAGLVLKQEEHKDQPGISIDTSLNENI